MREKGEVTLVDHAGQPFNFPGRLRLLRVRRCREASVTAGGPGSSFRMNWINIETATLDSEEFVGSDPTERATWLCLLRFCAGQENGGVIKNCRDWPDRKWQQLARVMQAEIELESALWKWVGDDLHLWRYPTDKETEVQQRRERARTNGRTGGRPSKKPTSETHAKPTSVHFAKAEGEREGEGEGERNTILAPAEAVAEGKPRDLIFEALCAATGTDARSLTKPGRGALNAALRDIRAASPEVTPAEVERRANRYARKFPTAALTASALAKHWAACAAPPADDWTRQQLKNAATATPTEFAHSLLADLPDVRAKFDIK
jgi:hypothetical protein